MSDEYGHKIQSFPLRMPPELRETIERNKPPNKSLTEEINQRLEQSLIDEEIRNDRLVRLERSLEDLHEKIDQLITTKREA